jgi:hypothetical protein
MTADTLRAEHGGFEFDITPNLNRRRQFQVTRLFSPCYFLLLFYACSLFEFRVISSSFCFLFLTPISCAFTKYFNTSLLRIILDLIPPFPPPSPPSPPPPSPQSYICSVTAQAVRSPRLESSSESAALWLRGRSVQPSPLLSNTLTAIL